MKSVPICPPLMLLWLGFRSIWSQKPLDTRDAKEPGPFSTGTRVTIYPYHRWAKGAEGTIAEPPSVVQENAGNWQGVTRFVQAVRGPLTFYWVYLDQPQVDDGGDGPFTGAEIDFFYLRPSSSGATRRLDIPGKDVEAVWYQNNQIGMKVEFKAFIKGTFKGQESEIHFERRYEAFSRGHYDQAIVDFNKTLEINSSYGLPYSFRGMAYYSKKEYGESLDDVTKAQELGHQVSPKFLDELRKASGREK